MAPPQTRPHTDTIVARLTAGGLEVGNHQAPDTDPPHVTVYLIAGGEIDGTVANPIDDGQLVWQITATGAGPEGAMWAADQARSLLAGWQPTVVGRSVMPLQLLAGLASGGATRDDDVNPPLYSAVDRYTAWTFPA